MRISETWKRMLPTAAMLLALAVGGSFVFYQLGGGEETPFGYRAVPRDAFPVFDDPQMAGAEEAERNGWIHPRDAVIGVAHRGEAKAYPISVMGLHELGNDTIGGVPIAVSW